MDSNNQNKALLCLYLYNAKIKVDSLLYISTLNKNNVNFDIDLYMYDIIKLFYINLRYATELICNAFGEEKYKLKNDYVFNKIFNGTDQNIVHKDSRYHYTDIGLKGKIEEMKKQLNHVYAYSKKNKFVLEGFTYEYYCFDSLLYRIINPVDNVKFTKKRTVFYISDDDKDNVMSFKNPDTLKEDNYKKNKNENGIEISNGINKEEKDQIMGRANLLRMIKWGI